MHRYDVPQLGEVPPFEWMQKASRAFENAHPGRKGVVYDRDGLLEDLRELEPVRREVNTRSISGLAE